MKQQSLITTLAVLLAVSLSAIVALVISTDVLDARQTAADVPASIAVQAPVPTAVPAEGPAAAGDDAATADSTDDDTMLPTLAAPEPAASAAAADGPEATPTTPAYPEPTPTDPEPTPTTPAGPEPTPTTPADDAPDAPGDDEPATGEPPCDGVIIDGECIDVSILCLLGYERVGSDCVFVGCPFGYALQDGYCQPFELAVPCGDGFVRLDDGTCVLDAVVLDPAVLQPLLCGEGFAWVGGECVTVCPPDHYWTNGFCLPEYNFEFDIADLSDIDFGAFFGA